MKLKLSHLAMAGACLALVACATAAPYRAAENKNATGYSDQQIEGNRYRVTFAGNSITSVQQVENYLLYRAAELTTQQGYDYFVIASRETESKDRFVDMGAGPMAARGRYWGFGWQYYSPVAGWGFGYDPFFDDVDLRQITKYKATAEIVMGRGAKPADNEHAYDARQVMANLGNTIKRPQ